MCFSLTPWEFEFLKSRRNWKSSHSRLRWIDPACFSEERNGTVEITQLRAPLSTQLSSHSQYYRFGAWQLCAEVHKVRPLRQLVTYFCITCKLKMVVHIYLLENIKIIFCDVCNVSCLRFRFQCATIHPTPVCLCSTICGCFLPELIKY